MGNTSKEKSGIKNYLAALLAVLFAAMMLVPVPARAAQADMDTVVSAAAEILYNNEGSYQSVNPNDNGAVSIGKLQWHGWRALSLMRTIVQADEGQAKELLGNALYKEISTTSDTTKWSTRKFSSSEAAAAKKLLATDESKAAQDELAVKDITSYIEQGQRLGITNEPALVYFADLANQGGSGAAGRVATSAAKAAGSYPAVTLNELHEAAVCDSVMGYSAYLNRRFTTYHYAAGLGWDYCSVQDSYIPKDYESAKSYGAAWLQRSLNQCMDAGLFVNNLYDEATKSAVMRFQSAKSLSVDGYAGKDTIVALIKAVFKSEAVTPGPGIPDENPGTPGEDPDLPNEGDGPDIQEPEPEPPAVPAKQAVLKASKASYAVNDTNAPFKLKVASNHSQSPVTYESTDVSVAVVGGDGQVSITGAGQAGIVARQAQTDTYQAAELEIPITVYSTSPSDYTVPTGALYDGKNMQKPQVQWLQAAFVSLKEADITVNGAWSKSMTSLVKKFQKKCGIYADGIAGTQTQDLIKNLLAVKEKKPVVSIKCSDKSNTLSWKKYTKANRVNIYRKEKGGSYKRIKSITNMKKTSYQDTAAKKGTTYYYVVRYAFVQNEMSLLGPSSKGVTGIRK